MSYELIEKNLKYALMLSDLKNKLKTENRYFTVSPILEDIKGYSARATQTINEGEVLWRARKWKSTTSNTDLWISLFENDMSESLLKTHYRSKPEELIGPFWGYKNDDSFIPKNNNQVNDARANPKYITYLYVAEEIETSIAEIRPRPCSLVNIAQISVKENLKIYDLARWELCDDDNYQNLIRSLSYAFSTPVNGELEDYLVSQYLSEFIKSLDFDGVRYWSSMMGYKKNSYLGKGKCVTIFNPDKCKVIGSQIHRINEINIDSNCVVPNKENTR